MLGPPGGTKAESLLEMTEELTTGTSVICSQTREKRVWKATQPVGAQAAWQALKRQAYTLLASIPGP